MALGIISSMTITYIRAKKDEQKRRRDKVWDLYEKFNSEKFLYRRSVVWNIYHNWDKNKQSVISYFLDDRAGNTLADDTKLAQTFQDNLNHLSGILYFWVEIRLNIRSNHVDKKLLKEVFSYNYYWWSKFMNQFLELYVKTRAESKTKFEDVEVALWEEAIPALNKFFEKDSTN